MTVPELSTPFQRKLNKRKTKEKNKPPGKQFFFPCRNQIKIKGLLIAESKTSNLASQGTWPVFKLLSPSLNEAMSKSQDAALSLYPCLPLC